MSRVTVIGAGVMGTALAIHIAKNGHMIDLWGTKWDREILQEMAETRMNRLLGQNIPPNINLFQESELEQALQNSKIIVLGVSSAGLKNTIEKISPYLKPQCILLSITKGIAEDSLCTMSKLIKDTIPDNLREVVPVVKLGGPLRANELAAGKYAEGVFASGDIEAASYCQKLFSSSTFRSEVSEDIEGVELCAALKNAYAITIGIVEGLEGEVDNPKAALMARGTVEMAEILQAYGCNPQTALGIAGVGDFYVTAQGGRNRTLGRFLGEGKSFTQAMELMKYQTVEGVPATKSGFRLVKKLELEKKLDTRKQAVLLQQLYRILFEDIAAREAISQYWSS